MKENNKRLNCKDVFNAFLVKDASYSDDLYEMPIIHYENTIPKKLIPFSKCLRSKEYDAWIHFYEDDYNFERVWRNPKKYLPIIKKFAGIITMDFSVYRDMPFPMQVWQIYRSRALGFWFQKNGIKVIVNMRYGDERTFNICCNGVPKNSIISIGSHGCIKDKEDRQIFISGLDFIIKELKPHTIIVYGSAPNKIFDLYRNMQINIIVYDSEFSKSHRGKN